MSKRLSYLVLQWRNIFSVATRTIISCALVIELSFGASISPASAVTAPLDFTGYAWSDTVGWISLNCANNASCATASYKVSLDTSTNAVSGYAWSDNVGWIEFGTPSSTAGCPSGICGAQKSGTDIIGWGRVTSGDGVVAPVVSPGTTTYAIAGTSTFSVPAGVTNIKVKAWGGGGGGASSGFGGGGGGAMADYTVTPGENLTAVVGAGGSAAGTNAGPTKLLRGATALMNAGGGAGSTNGSNGAGGNFSVSGFASYGFGQTGGAPQPPYTTDPSYPNGVGVGKQGTITTTILAPKVDYTTGAGPSSVAVGDLNKDGYPDFIAPNSGSNNVSVFINKKNGTFNNKVDYPGGAGPWGVAIGDINGDGNADMVVANNGGTSVSVFKGTGTGTFGAKTDFTVGANPTDIALGDFDTDGDLDIVTGNTGGNTVSILFNNGSGTFAGRTDYTVGSNSQSVAVGDLNADTKPDIAIVNYASGGGSTVSVLINKGNGTFNNKVDYTTGAGPDGLAFGDLNEDSKLDMVVSNFGPTGNGNTVSVFRGNGDGTFQPKTTYTTGLGPSNVTIADFSGDGNLDIATANATANTVSVLENNTSGGFLAKVDYAGGAGGIARGDFNADGIPDIVATKYGGGAGTIASVLIPSPVYTGAAGTPGYLELTYTAVNSPPLNGTDGWISLSSLNGGGGTYGLTVGTNSLGGYAWGSEVMGWIDFSATSFTPPCSISNICSIDHTQSINTDAWCTVATTTCSAGYICKDTNGLCGVGNPSGTMTFSNQKVKRGKTVSISWNVLYADSCVVSGTNGDSWTPASSSAQTSQPIQNETTYTLNCQPVGGGAPVLLDTKKVTLIPSIREF